MMENLTLELCDPDADRKHMLTSQFIVPTIVLGILNVVVIFGNSLVIVAVFTSQKLRTVTNLFIVSLAVADLSLGVTVLPFSIANEVLGYWVFGPIWCEIWLAVDVWMCTASILNLVAISFDRYLAITHPFKYPHLMSSFRGKVLIGLVWVLSFLICFPPLLGWGVEDHSTLNSTSAYNISNSTTVESITGYSSAGTTISPIVLHNSFTESSQNVFLRFVNSTNSTNITGCVYQQHASCAIKNSERGYIIYSAMGSFYLPSIVMVFFYLRIYSAAVRTTQALKRGVLTTKTSGSEPFSRNSEQRVTLRIHRGGSTIKGQRTSQYNSNNNQNHNSHHHHHHNGVGDHKQRGSRIDGSSTNASDNTVFKDRNVKKAVSRIRLKIKRSPACDFTLLDGEESHLDSTVNNGSSKVSYKKRQRKADRRCNFTESDDTEECVAGGGGSGGGDGGTTGTANTTAAEKKNSNFARSLGKRNLKSQLRKINKETKAAKTVGIIVGCFIVCWCPFFTVYITAAFCANCTPPLIFIVCFWLGYCNSAVNPCVYALFSKDFRYAFQKLLCCHRQRRRRRLSRGRASLMTSIRIQATSKESDSLSDSK